MCLLAQLGSWQRSAVQTQQPSISTLKMPTCGQWPVKPLRVLLADKLAVIVDKPAGILAVPGRCVPESVATLLQHSTSSAVDRQADCIFQSARTTATLLHIGPRAVHRLDEPTSGLMMFPTSSESLSFFAKLLIMKRVRKTYECVVDTRARGHELADEGVISTPLAPNSHVGLQQAWDPAHAKGNQLKEAVTQYRVIERGIGAARLEMSPETGRTHQLRLHAALPPPFGLGCPILGDRFYGDPRLCIDSYQHEITARARSDTSHAAVASVASMLLQLERRRLELGTEKVMPMLPSCTYLDPHPGSQAPREVLPVSRLLLHAKQLTIPDDFNGNYEEGLDGPVGRLVSRSDALKDIWQPSSVGQAMVSRTVEPSHFTIDATIGSWKPFQFAALKRISAEPVAASEAQQRRLLTLSTQAPF